MGRGGVSGGRSSGGSFGGSRSSGGRSGGSFGGGRSGGSLGSGGIFGGSRSSGSRGSGSIGGGLFGGSRGTGNSGGSFGSGSGGNRTPIFTGGGSGGRPVGGGGCAGMGCGSVAGVVFVGLIFVILFFIVVANAATSNTASGSGITNSTVERQALRPGSVNETDYYTDRLGWIGNETELLAGLKHFYQKTGVQPYLYITDTVNNSHSPSAEELDSYARSLYNELFTDEAHLLFLFFEYDNSYMDRYVCGTQAKTVIDREAADILLDYIDRYYYDGDLSEEAFFSKAFADAADRIMTVTRSPWIIVLVVTGAVVLALILFVWWRHAKKQKNLEARQTEEMLKTPLEKFGDMGEAEKLAEKYKKDGGTPE